jgi:hypothetical protein
MNCPHCNQEISPEELKSLWASYTGSLQTPHAGPGRPRKAKRCPCGAMTVTRARQRGHKCQKEPK